MCAKNSNCDLYPFKIYFTVTGALVAQEYNLGLAFESTGFRSQLRKASMSSHTDEFWSNKTDLFVDYYIYVPNLSARAEYEKGKF